jgi:hypothetical protein
MILCFANRLGRRVMRGVMLLRILLLEVLM